MFNLWRGLVAFSLALMLLAPTCCCASKVSSLALPSVKQHCCSKKQAPNSPHKPCQACSKNSKISSEERNCFIVQLIQAKLKLGECSGYDLIAMSQFPRTPIYSHGDVLLEKAQLDPQISLVIRYRSIRC